MQRGRRRTAAEAGPLPDEGVAATATAAAAAAIVEAVARDIQVKFFL